MSRSEERTSLAELLADLESPLEEVRMGALRSLAGYPSMGMFRAVRRLAATDPSVSVRFEARRVLSAGGGGFQGVGPEDPEAVEAALSALSAPDPKRRISALESLARSGDPRAGTTLIARLAVEDDLFVLGMLLGAVGSVAGPGGGDALIPFAEHEDPRIRLAALEALDAAELSGGLSAVPQLVRALNDPSRSVQAYAARSLKARSGPQLMACVDRMLADRDDATRRSALSFSRFLGAEQAVPRLREHLKDEAGETRRVVLQSLAALARRGSVEAASLLKDAGGTAPAEPPALEDESSALLAVDQGSPIESADPAQRIRAIRNLVRAGDPEGLPLLRRRLESEDDPAVLATLVSALGHLGQAADRENITPFLRAQDSRLRANAVEALGRLGGTGVVEILSPYLQDENNRVRANAVVALRSAPEVDLVSVLNGMAQEPREGFAASAVWAAGQVARLETVRFLGQLARQGSPDIQRRARETLQTLAPVMPEAEEALPEDLGQGAVSSPPVELPSSRLRRLLFDLESESREVRLHAVKAAAAVRDPRLLGGLQKSLAHADPMVRHAARHSIRQVLHESPPVSPDPYRLARFERELKAGGQKALTALGGLLSLALECGVEGTAAVIWRRLEVEVEPSLRGHLVTALGFVAPEGTRDGLVALLSDPDPRVRANVLDVIGLMGSEDDRALAIRGMADPDPRVRAAAVRVSAPLYPEPFLTRLRSLLGSRTVADRSAGLFVVRSLQFPQKIELLKEHFVVESDPGLREQCADSLAAEAAGGNREEIETFLESLEEGARRECLEMALVWTDVGGAGDTGAAEESGECGVDSTSVSQVVDRVRLGVMSDESLAEALRSTQDAQTTCFLLERARERRIPKLHELALHRSKHPDRRVRLASVRALGIGLSGESREGLIRLVQDRDPEVSKKALEELALQDADAAHSALRRLTDLGEAWALGRGLVLAEILDDARVLDVVYKALERDPGPGSVEPLTRLVVRWGDRKLLERLGEFYRRAPVSRRPLLRELGHAVGRRMRISPEAVARCFEGPGGRDLTRGLGGALDGLFEMLRQPVVVGGGLLLGVVGLAWLALAGGDPGPRGRPARLPRSAAMEGNRSLKRIVRTRDSGLGGARIRLERGRPMRLSDFRPTLETVEESLTRMLAAEGISSEAVIHMMALDRVQLGYRKAIERAQQLAALGDHERALDVLETALGEVAPDHLIGRLTLLRYLTAMGRRARRFERVREWNQLLAEAEAELIGLLSEAGREGGVPEGEIQAALSALEKRETSREKLGRIADFFSGAELAGRL